MARPLRLEHSGAIWHVTSRGNEKKDIFHVRPDRAEFLNLLARTVERCRWALHAFVLMSNHYHLLIETPEPTLSRGMHDLNGLYTQWFNRKYRRVGHLFQGRFKGILIEKESHLLEVARYVVLNPVRAGIAARAAEWSWSSYRATAGLVPSPEWLQVDWTLSQFALDRTTATIRYRDFVAAGEAHCDRPWDRLAGQIFLGSARFQRRMRARIESTAIGDDIPRRQVRIGRPGLSWIIETTARVAGPQARRGPGAAEVRALIAFLAREDSGVGLGAIGAALSVRPSMASRLARRGARLVEDSPGFRRHVEEIRRLWVVTWAEPDKEYRIKA